MAANTFASNSSQQNCSIGIFHGNFPHKDKNNAIYEDIKVSTIKWKYALFPYVEYLCNNYISSH